MLGSLWGGHTRVEQPMIIHTGCNQSVAEGTDGCKGLLPRSFKYLKSSSYQLNLSLGAAGCISARKYAAFLGRVK